MLGRALFGDWPGDVRQVIRGWRRRPALLLTMAATLSQGVGLSAAVFSFADGSAAVLRRPPRYFVVPRGTSSSRAVLQHQPMYFVGGTPHSAIGRSSSLFLNEKFVRGLALGELTWTNARHALFKEGIVGLGNGLALGLVAAIGAWLWTGSPVLGGVLALATVFLKFLPQ
jgi:hypothetical protein